MVVVMPVREFLTVLLELIKLGLALSILLCAVLFMVIAIFFKNG